MNSGAFKHLNAMLSEGNGVSIATPLRFASAPAGKAGGENLFDRDHRGTPQNRVAFAKACGNERTQRKDLIGDRCGIGDKFAFGREPHFSIERVNRLVLMDQRLKAKIIGSGSPGVDEKAFDQARTDALPPVRGIHLDRKSCFTWVEWLDDEPPSGTGSGKPIW
jgi:hypothetical protein